MTKGIGSAAKWGLGLAAAAGTGMVALLGVATKASETAAEIDDMANKTNMSASSLQEWKYAAEQSGFSLDTIEGSAVKLTKTLGNYASGSKTTIEAFKQLGVSATDSTGKLRTTNDVFPEIMASLADMEDITARDALSMQIFGKSAMDMAPLLNEGSDGMEALKIKAGELGLVMGDDAIAAGAKFDDMMATVKSSLGAMVTRIGTEVLPIAQRFLEWVMTKMPTIQAIASVVFGVVSDVIGIVGNIIENYLMPALSNMWAWLQPNIPIIKEFVVNAFDAIKDALSNVSDFISVYLVPAFNDFWAWLQPNLPLIKEIVQSAFDTMKSAVSGVVDVLKSVIDWCIKYQEILIPLAAGIVAGATVFGIYSLALGIAATATGIWATITGIAAGVGAVFGAVLAFITSPIGLVVIAIGLLIAIGVLLYRNWDVICAFLKGIFTSIWDFTIGIFTSIVDFFKKWGTLILAIITGPIGILVYIITTYWEEIKNGAISVFSAIGDFIGGIVDGISSAFSGLVNGIIDNLNWIIGAVNGLSFDVPDWVPGIGGETFGFDIPTIPSFAVGTRYLPKDMLVQAHEGEMIVPKSENPYANTKTGETLPDSGGFTIKIENFINNRQQDVEAFAEELQFYMKQKAVGGGN